MMMIAHIPDFAQYEWVSLKSGYVIPHLRKWLKTKSHSEVAPYRELNCYMMHASRRISVLSILFRLRNNIARTECHIKNKRKRILRRETRWVHTVNHILVAKCIRHSAHGLRLCGTDRFAITQPVTRVRGICINHLCRDVTKRQQSH